MDEQKKAIIMGATSGIGREVAKELLCQGYTIGIAGRRQQELEDFKKEVKLLSIFKSESAIYTKVIDVTSVDAPALLLDLIEEMGGVDLYFHSSGYGKQNTALEIDIEKTTAMTNVFGFTQMIDTAFNYFKNRKHPGHIACISSIAGTKGLGAAPSYSATKRFQWTYIEALSQLSNMQNLGIHFTDIRPGFVATDFIKGSNFPLQLDKQFVARKIMKAISHNKRIVTIDWRYRIVCFFWRNLPGWLWEKLNITS